MKEEENEGMDEERAKEEGDEIHVERLTVWHIDTSTVEY